MVGLLEVGIVSGFLAGLLATVFGLESFIVKRNDKEISEKASKFKSLVIDNDTKNLKTEKEKDIFYNDYKISLELDKNRKDAETYGLRTYLLLIASAITIIAYAFYPNALFFNFNIMPILLFAISFFTLIQFSNYLDSLRLIRKEILKIEERIQETELYLNNLQRPQPL